MKITKIPHSPIWQFAFRNPLDVIANELSRQAMKRVKEAVGDFKKFVARHEEIGQQRTYLLEFVDPTDKVSYNLKFIVTRVNDDRAWCSYGAAVKVIGKFMRVNNRALIRCNVDIGNSFSEKNMTRLYSAIKEAMRHELEHFSKQPVSPWKANECDGNPEEKARIVNKLVKIYENIAKQIWPNYQWTDHLSVRFIKILLELVTSTHSTSGKVFISFERAIDSLAEGGPAKPISITVDSQSREPSGRASVL